MIRRVVPYGFGKILITIKMSELPQDIQQGIIEYDEKLKIKEDTDNIIIVCEKIISKKDKGIGDKT
jgi:hypothetical protein